MALVERLLEQGVLAEDERAITRNRHPGVAVMQVAVSRAKRSWYRCRKSNEQVTDSGGRGIRRREKHRMPGVRSGGDPAFRLSTRAVVTPHRPLSIQSLGGATD